MEKIFSLLNIAPEYVQYFAWMAGMIGLWVIWRFKRIVFIIATAAIAMYITVKKSIAGDFDEE